MRETTGEFDPGPLGALTFEQREVLDLLSRGIMRYEIARRRQARTEEILDVVDSVNEILETSDSAASTYRLLKEGLLFPAPDEAAGAQEKMSLLSDGQKAVLGVMMDGRRYDEAGKVLGMDADEVRIMMDDISSIIHSHSPEQTVRLAYAAGLDEAEAEPASEDAETPGQAEALPVSKENVSEFIKWMHPKERLELDGLDEDELAALAERIRSMAKEYVAGLPTPKHKRQAKPVLGYVDQWLEGESIPRIANKAGKHDGSIRLSLMGIAEKMGSKLGPDRLL